MRTGLASIVGLVTAALALGCNDSALAPHSSEPEAPPRRSEAPPLAETYDLTGRVTTVHGAPLAGAEVRLAGRLRTTDRHGMFEARLPRDGAVQVFVEAEGWTQGHRRVLPPDSDAVALEIAVLPTRTMHLPDAGAGGRVEGDVGVALEFPPNAFEDAEGAPYAGRVEVEYALLNTAESIAAAPGDMTARVDDGETALESFGMVEVEFFDRHGRPLEFVGESARLEIPASDTHDFEDGEAVPMWTFDEESGVWLREGSGYYADDMVVATVPHFSWWNVDMPMITSCVTGVVDPAGTPLTAQAIGVDYRGSNSGIVQAGGIHSGSFCVSVRTDSVFDLNLTAIVPGQGLVSAVRQAGLQSNATPGFCSGPGACLDLGVVSLAHLTDADGDGDFVELGDCDDADPAVGPSAGEVCNGIDDDCNGGVDDHAPDADGDGFSRCFDCDDWNADVYPDAPAVCDGALDQNCDEQIDSIDVDGDGDGVSRCGGDCDDADPDVIATCDFARVSVSETQACAVRESGLVCWGQNAVPVAAAGAGMASVATGHSTTCGSAPGEGAACWGLQELTLPSVGTALGEFEHIAVGDTHVCALRVSGGLECWGNPADGRLAVPPGSYQGLSAARNFTCALPTAGSVVCWGAMPPGQPPPPALFGAARLDLSETGGCVLRDDATVVCWGSVPDPAAGMPPFVDVSAGASHACGQMEDGRLLCWGDDTYGQLQAPPYIFESFDAGADTTCGLRPNDQVECWGRGENGTADSPR